MTALFAIQESRSTKHTGTLEADLARKQIQLHTKASSLNIAFLSSANIEIDVTHSRVFANS